MFSHILTGTNDVASAMKFYDAVLRTLGIIDGNPSTVGTEAPSNLNVPPRNKHRHFMTPLSTQGALALKTLRADA